MTAQTSEGGEAALPEGDAWARVGDSRSPVVLHRLACNGILCEQDCDGRALCQEDWDACWHIYPPQREPIPATPPPEHADAAPPSTSKAEDDRP